MHPAAVNSIPSRVRLTIDLADIDGASRDDVKSAIESSIRSIADRRGLACEIETLNSDPPAIASASIIDAARSACDESGLKYQTMISRAYHDSLFMAQIAPMSMLFIPCRGGVSHRPDEYSSPAEITRGIEVFAPTLARLSSD